MLKTGQIQRSDLLVHLGVEPIFDDLRALRGFRKLLQSIGL